ncbi:hypothetical protein PR202_gb17095 [Eleusine coracana subsp. coracana]|uniref:Uncharacterized protein n=1 Tax=Eleusine coracana subsp. coracana TaxID=191504 RepID=A0AAV5F3S1_ELECO|nr:hypothetical protein PR202_gb17095 [Eleusine coracana subsp. coracana]
MATGDGANSYATNSRLQDKVILETKPLLHKAVEELYMSLAHRSTMVVADLGCSSGPNTLLFISEVISAIRTRRGRDHQETGDQRAVEVQFFLNDLPGNDFNLVFRSLERLQKLVVAEDEAVALPYYVAGLPGSFYTRVPEDLSSGTHLNEGNINIGKTTPSEVGSVQREKLCSFNLPFYAPSANEVNAIINQQEMFSIECIKLFESNWDPHCDSDAEVVLDCDRSADSIVMCIRAVVGPLIADHFGESILDELFLEYASIVAKHLKEGMARYSVIMVSLKKIIR